MELNRELKHYLKHRNEVIDKLIKLLITTKEYNGSVIGNPEFNAVGMLNHIIEYDDNAGVISQLIELYEIQKLRVQILFNILTIKGQDSFVFFYT